MEKMMEVLDGSHYIVELANVGCIGRALHNVDLSCVSIRFTCEISYFRATLHESCHHVLADDVGRIRTGCKVLPRERKVRLATFLLQKKVEGRWKSILASEGFRGHEQRRFTPKVNISSHQDFKSRFGGQASRNMSFDSAYQRQSKIIPSQYARSTRAPTVSRKKEVVGRPRQYIKVYAMTQQEAEDAPDVITSTILVSNVPAFVLCDPSATHSFISITFLTKLNRMLEPLYEELVIYTPVGVVLLVNEVLRNCEKEVIFRKPGFAEVVFRGVRKIIHRSLISVLKAEKLLRKGCTMFLAHVVEVQREKLKPKDDLAVKEFLDVFPDDLSSLPPDREI
ncbi:putative DNA/RNA polymerases superfamily protein [Cucumis melo var. makuwa]|uniref:Putative DNA/RNA polymerases superfamily protein n=1 Tax=Cucumis melo var. makuwa TaxID=1194695 RepID=A0A5D3CHK1_CUCMM|nr:putative DNA/RNA polymerases superfamily protein [Cucumis melo var. makuwa]